LWLRGFFQDQGVWLGQEEPEPFSSAALVLENGFWPVFRFDGWVLVGLFILWIIFV
jgi:hypothetical protein